MTSEKHFLRAFKQDNDVHLILLYFFIKDFSGSTLTAIIGGEKEDNERLGKFFIERFGFANKTIEQALRSFFLIFQLKGESQCIERILTLFTESYLAQNQGYLKLQHADDIFRLVYSIIMLNTDQHNMEVEKKMQLSDFNKVVRYVLNAEQLSDEEIEGVYNNVRANEIKHLNPPVFLSKPLQFTQANWDEYLSIYESQIASL